MQRQAFNTSHLDITKNNDVEELFTKLRSEVLDVFWSILSA